jgi:hypothetical protein
VPAAEVAWRSLLDPMATYTLLKHLQAVTGGGCD